MKPVTLSAQFSTEMDCRKVIVMWNYHDHEHLVGVDSSCALNKVDALVNREKEYAGKAPGVSQPFSQPGTYSYDQIDIQNNVWIQV